MASYSALGWRQAFHHELRVPTGFISDFSAKDARILHPAREGLLLPLVFIFWVEHQRNHQTGIMKGGNRISFVPDNRLLLAFDRFELVESLAAGATTLAESVLLHRAERSQRRGLRVMAAKVITDPAAVAALLPRTSGLHRK